MVRTATVTLSGIEMDESEYVCTLSHSTRFEFTNGVVTAKRGPYMTQKAHVTAANVLTLALPGSAARHGGYAGQTPTANLSSGGDRLYRDPGPRLLGAVSARRGRNLLAPDAGRGDRFT
jgi:hypothetical protein